MVLLFLVKLVVDVDGDIRDLPPYARIAEHLPPNPTLRLLIIIETFYCRIWGTFGGRESE
jgi:hypothetical protein